MEDFRTSYATSGQVVDLWRVIEGLRLRLETLTSRLESLERNGGTEGSGSDAAGAGSAGAREAGSRVR